jgi:hypothetical protein
MFLVAQKPGTTIDGDKAKTVCFLGEITGTIPKNCPKLETERDCFLYLGN